MEKKKEKFVNKNVYQCYNKINIECDLQRSISNWHFDRWLLFLLNEIFSLNTSNFHLLFCGLFFISFLFILLFFFCLLYFVDSLFFLVQCCEKYIANIFIARNVFTLAFFTSITSFLYFAIRQKGEQNVDVNGIRFEVLVFHS